MPPVARREPAHAVPTGADRDDKVLVPSEANGSDHVEDPAAARDHRRTAVDHAVPHDPGRVVVGAAREHDLALERLAERRERVHAHA